MPNPALLALLNAALLTDRGFYSFFTGIPKDTAKLDEQLDQSPGVFTREQASGLVASMAEEGLVSPSTSAELSKEIARGARLVSRGYSLCHYPESMETYSLVLGIPETLRVRIQREISDLKLVKDSAEAPIIFPLVPKTEIL